MESHHMGLGKWETQVKDCYQNVTSYKKGDLGRVRDVGWFVESKAVELRLTHALQDDWKHFLSTAFNQSILSRFASKLVSDCSSAYLML